MDEAFTRRVAAGLAAVQAQTAYVHEHFGRAASHWKHDGTRVTTADLAVSRAVFAQLAAQFPADQFFSEETEPGGGPVPVAARFCWVLDPIDGTNNYALGVPVCAISLALLEDGVPVCGFVYDLGLRTTFHGGPGLGVLANGSPVARLENTSREARIVALHAPVATSSASLLGGILGGYKLRAFGSGSLHLTYAALGRVDAAIDLTVRVWDIAAAWAFCRSTGVEVRFLDAPAFPMRTFDLHMRPVRYLAAAPALCAELASRLEQAGMRFAG
jgi:myo-inositol-1(or 4)-monophosphatase